MQSELGLFVRLAPVWARPCSPRLVLVGASCRRQTTGPGGGGEPKRKSRGMSRATSSVMAPATSSRRVVAAKRTAGQGGQKTREDIHRGNQAGKGKARVGGQEYLSEIFAMQAEVDRSLCLPAFLSIWPSSETGTCIIIIIFIHSENCLFSAG